MSNFKPCVVIPVFNHHHTLKNTVEQLLAQALPVFIVDDGSSSDCKSVIREIAAMSKQVGVVEHKTNMGKGAAVKTGLQSAFHDGFTHALQVDADGQHNLSDIPKFLDTAISKPESLIVGTPLYDESVPKQRLYARYLTHVWVWINTLSLEIRDSMCGFRVYPLVKSDLLISSEPIGNRMDFDTEFIVRWYWRNWQIQNLHTQVIYPENGISHFLVWRDNKLIAWMHTRLFFGMLRRLPTLIFRKFVK